MPTEAIARLTLGKTERAVARLFTKERELSRQKDLLVDALFRAIGTVEDRDLRRALLTLKRDVFNLRGEGLTLDARLGEALAPEVATRLSDFVDLLKACERQRAAVAAAYVEEVAFSRSRLRTVIDDDAFQKGLLLSSRSLYDQAQLWRAGRQRAGSSKARKTERGLLRYLTRMAMKATPFGTFCSVVPGEFSDPGRREAARPPLLSFTGDPRPKQSYARLNKSLYGILLGHLKGRPAVRHSLAVDRNPTIERDGLRLRFLVGSGSGETFQRLDSNPVLDLVLSDMLSGGERSYGALLDRLCNDGRIDATREDVESYLDRLIEIGFLRFRTGIRQQDPDWDLRLRDLCDTMDDEHARICSELLGHLRSLLDRYSRAGHEERPALLDEAYDRMERALTDMEIVGRPHKDLLLYEDASAPVDAKIAAEPDCGPFRDLVDFVGLVLKVAWPRGEQATMRHFFDVRYDPHASVPLLRFYEDYYREHFKAHLERQQRSREGTTDSDGYDFSNPFGLDFVDRVNRAVREMTDLVRRRWAKAPAAEEITIEQRGLEDILADIPPVARGPHSFNVFAQSLPVRGRNGGPSVLLPGGNLLPGYGKFFSRFLDLLPARMRTDLCRWNDGLCQALLAEIALDSNFNANLHPPVVAWEIAYPTAEGGRKGEQLSTSEILVEQDPVDEYCLRLKHAPSGQCVIPLDLGFLTPQARPPLFQLLSRLTPAAGFMLSIPETPDMKGGGYVPESDGKVSRAQGHAVVYRPRIVFGQGLVLARRTWIVPRALWPSRTQEETEVEHFIRVQRWRRQLGIPRAVYVRVRPWARPVPEEQRSGAAGSEAPEGAPTAGTGEEPAAVARGDPRRPTKGASYDFAKPQYIDFDSPLLVGLLQGLAGPLRDYCVVVEERLPDEAELPEHRGRHHAVEMVLQVDFPERGSFDPRSQRLGEAVSVPLSARKVAQ